MSFNASYVPGGRFDPPFYPSKPLPFIKGHKLSAVMGNNVHTYTLPYDVEFLGVAVSCSEYDLDDYWTLTIAGVVIVESSYTKDLPEGMFFTAFPSPPKDAVVKFEFYNNGAAKEVWFNYQMLRDG